jgi:2-methylisocitrate lyase-like PEP mutase family enzyme
MHDMNGRMAEGGHQPGGRRAWLFAGSDRDGERARSHTEMSRPVTHRRARRGGPGVAGIRIDDQPIEGKRKTQSVGAEVVPLDRAIARYRAAVEMRNELDPNFVVMAQCYARDASHGTLEDTIARLRAYRDEAGVDWVQFESPHSVDEIRAARAAITGPFSFMKGKLGRYLDLDEHLALGVTIAWYPGFTHHVTWVRLT